MVIVQPAAPVVTPAQPLLVQSGPMIGLLEIRVINTSEFHKSRWFCEPYVAVSLLGTKVRTHSYGGSDKNTFGRWSRVIKASVNQPVTIRFELFDSAFFGKDKLLGSCEVVLNDAIQCPAMAPAPYALVDDSGTTWCNLNLQIILWPRSPTDPSGVILVPPPQPQIVRAPAPAPRPTPAPRRNNNRGLLIGAAAGVAIGAGLAAASHNRRAHARRRRRR